MTAGLTRFIILTMASLNISQSQSKSRGFIRVGTQDVGLPSSERRVSSFRGSTDGVNSHSFKVIHFQTSAFVFMVLMRMRSYHFIHS